MLELLPAPGCEESYAETTISVQHETLGVRIHYSKHLLTGREQKHLSGTQQACGTSCRPRSHTGQMMRFMYFLVACRSDPMKYGGLNGERDRRPFELFIPKAPPASGSASRIDTSWMSRTLGGILTEQLVLWSDSPPADPQTHELLFLEQLNTL